MPVRIYVMGGGDAHKTPEGRIYVGGHWRDEQDWPLPRTHATPYYSHGQGILSPEKPSGDSPIQYLFDPRNPVPTLGGNISSQGTLMFQGAADQRCRPDFWLCKNSKPLSARNDILVFQTPPLMRDMEVTGRLIVKLWASSNSLDTDFTAKLIDVYPPNAGFPAGVDLNVADSIVRARYRNSPGKTELLKPAQPYEFTIEMYPTSLLYIMVGFVWLFFVSHRPPGEEDIAIREDGPQRYEFAAMLCFLLFAHNLLGRIEGAGQWTWVWLGTGQWQLLLVFGLLSLMWQLFFWSEIIQAKHRSTRRT